MARGLINRLFARKPHTTPVPRKIVALIIFGAAVLVFISVLWIGIPMKTKGTIRAGVTFSVPYAKELGINWREALTASLDDLGIRYYRIPAYWSMIEPKKGEFDWGDLDYQMNEIGMRNGKVILAVGAKLPRWPECWIPDWALYEGKDIERQERLQYLEAVVNRYKDHSTLLSWQVENEALFPFGVCPKPNRSYLKQEIELVRRLDISHQIATTDSGELSTWVSVGSLVDRLGISTYRTVKTFWGARWKYTFIPTYWYARRAALVKPFVKEVYVSEFQMEPWAEQSLTVTPISAQMESFPISQMKDNFEFAERMRFNEVYFWGVEWWWWMKVKQQDSRFWDMAKSFYQSHPMPNE